MAGRNALDTVIHQHHDGPDSHSHVTNSKAHLEEVRRGPSHQKDQDERPKLPWLRLNNPSIQIILASLSLFFNPGLYFALIFLGAGGGRPSSTSMANISNGALYAMLAVCGPLAGVFLNIVGPRWTMLLGTSGYPIYQGAMWYFDVHGNIWFPILAGAYVGMTGALLWTTAIFTTIAYSEEGSRGRWRSCQWTISTTGSLVGAALAMGISWNSTSDEVPHAVYAVFIVLQIVSLGIALFLLDPKTLRRGDGSLLVLAGDCPTLPGSLNISMKLFGDWKILLMIPCIIVPEMFFPLQTSINAYAFTLRTRTLNALLNNLIQVFTSILLGYVLDMKRLGGRKRRAMYGITLCAVWIITANIAQTIWLASWNFDRSLPGPMIDYTDSSYAAAIAVYLLYAGEYGLFPSLVQWVLGTLSNEPRKVAAITGIYTGILSAGTAISFGVDATAQPYSNENGAYFALSTLCWPILYFMAWKCITDTNHPIVRDDVALQYSERSHELGDLNGGTENSETIEASELKNE